MHELSLDNSPRFLKTPNSSFLKQNTIKERWTVRYFTVIVLKTLHNNYIKKKKKKNGSVFSPPTRPSIISPPYMLSPN